MGFGKDFLNSTLEVLSLKKNVLFIGPAIVLWDIYPGEMMAYRSLRQKLDP